jgi:arylsulfatase A-like enzyme
MFEGGVRVPFVMKWPAGIPKGETYTHPVSSLDVFPTALVAAGGKLPKKGVLNGVDLAPYLNGQKSGKPNEKLFWRTGKVWAARQGDWKLIYAADRHWLYDLAKDPGEITNLAEKRPDIVKVVTASYDKWNEGNIKPLWPSFAAKAMPQYSVDGVPVSWPF